MININDYSIEKECYYKDEKYSVRDNGAIFRHQRKGKKKRPNDGFWTFGEPDFYHHGYMCLSGIRVHRIVATAFWGEAPGDQYVVDHIDTNRQNNRPENLRWVTKLENLLLNEITRSKIVHLCGSVENFLKNPHLLFNHEIENPNFSWMRTVAKEEASNTLAHWHELINGEQIYRGGKIGDWIYQPVHEVSPTFTDCTTRDEADFDEIHKRLHDNFLEIEKTLQKKAQETTLPKPLKVSPENCMCVENLPKQSAVHMPEMWHEPSYNKEENNDDEAEDLYVSQLEKFKPFIINSDIELSQPEISNRILDASTHQSIVAIHIYPFSYPCYQCKEINWAYFVKYIELDNGDVLNCPDFIDFAFKPAVIEAVNKWTAEHTVPKDIFGEIKNRFSRTCGESYMSFGCRHCDGLLGNHFFKKYVFDVIYDEDGTIRIPVEKGKLEYQIEK